MAPFTIANLASVIALDGGTTNTRAQLINSCGEVIASASRAIGVRNTAVASDKMNQKAELFQAVSEVIAEVLPSGNTSRSTNEASPAPNAVVAAGMLSSEVGLYSVPHLIAPAGIHELANAVKRVFLPEITNLPIYFIPGVRTPPTEGVEGWTNSDLMRGEECETFGALFMLQQKGEVQDNCEGVSHAFVWPGSHTKLIELDEHFRITRSTTSIAGELIQAIWKHTLLAASLPSEWPREIDLEAATAGKHAVLKNGLGRAAFLVRIASVGQILNPIERASFWLGAVLADDAIHLTRHPILTATPRTVWVGGREPLRGLLTRFLKEENAGPVIPLEETIIARASAQGANLIAATSRASQSD